MSLHNVSHNATDAPSPPHTSSTGGGWGFIASCVIFVVIETTVTRYINKNRYRYMENRFFTVRMNEWGGYTQTQTRLSENLERCVYAFAAVFAVVTVGLFIVQMTSLHYNHGGTLGLSGPVTTCVGLLYVVSFFGALILMGIPPVVKVVCYATGYTVL